MSTTAWTFPSSNRESLARTVAVEGDCWVGSNAIFLDSAQVGRGCVIAAGAVVTGTIPAYFVVAGFLGRVIKTRKQEALAFASERQTISQP
jgi:acetyltransferase-like isoleucine patch superfamily enzyme